MTRRRITESRSQGKSKRPALEARTADHVKHVEPTPILFVASAVCEAVTCDYRQCKASAAQPFAALAEQLSQFPGHVVTHPIDCSDGSIAFLTFISARDDDPVCAEEELTLLFQYDGKALTVHRYEQGRIELTPEMLTADPRHMDHLDARYLYPQIIERLHGYVPW
jgi:hypothetical protein